MIKYRGKNGSWAIEGSEYEGENTYIMEVNITTENVYGVYAKI